MLALILASGLACQEIDVSRTVTLVPSDEMTTDQVDDLESAARCWNATFATSLEVGRQHDGDQQAVEVGLSRFLCGYRLGQTLYSTETRVLICDGAIRSDFFYIAQHELGHVLNIVEHARGSTAVMKANLGRYSYFTAEDRQMFYVANPEYAARSRRCGVHVIDSPGHRASYMIPMGGWATTTARQRTFVAYSDREGVYLDRLREADLGTERTITIEPRGKVLGVMEAVGTEAGVHVFWVEEEGEELEELQVSVDPVTMKASELRRLSVNGSGQLLVDAVRSGDDFVGVYPDDQGGHNVYVLAVSSGAGKRLVLHDPESSAAWVAGQAGAIYLARYRSSSSSPVISVQRLDLTGQTSPKELPLRWPKDARLSPYGRLVGGSRGLLMAVATRDSSVLVGAVNTNGLGQRRSVEVKPPPWCSYYDYSSGLDLAAGGGRVALTLACTRREVDSAQTEVFVTLLDETNLGTVAPWKMVSAPDRVTSRSPSAVVSRDNLMLTWREYGHLAYRVAYWGVGEGRMDSCPTDP